MPSSIYGYDFDHELIDFLIPGDSLDNASVGTKGQLISKANFKVFI